MAPRIFVKIANFSCFFSPSIPKRDLDTNKTTPNEEVWPESQIEYSFQRNFLDWETVRFELAVAVDYVSYFIIYW